MFNIIESNSCLIIENLVESSEEWSQERLQSFMIRYHHKVTSVTVLLHNFFHQSKFYEKTCFELYLLYHLYGFS